MNKKKRGNYNTKNVILLSKIIKQKDSEVDKEIEKKVTEKNGND